MKTNRGTPDFWVMFLSLAIVGFGIVMVFSSSFTVSYWEMGNRWFFTQRQIIWAGIGLLMMLLTMNIPFRFYKKYFFVFLSLSFILLILVFVKFIGKNLNGANSWIGVGTMSIQPAEFAKLGLIIYLAALISKKKDKMKTFKDGLLPALIISFIFFFLIALQPDYGTAFILLGTAITIIFVGGANLKYILYLLLTGLLFIPLIFISAGYRLSRFNAFMDPWSDPYGNGYHLIQSLIAFGNGGIMGAGFGKGIQKYFYLPYPQSDFIFSVIGEELGFVGVVIFLVGFLVLLWRILFISAKSKDIFGKLVGVGIVTSFAFQAFINIGGVTGAIPITGVPLPFISAGGSSLITSMSAIGIILSLSRENNKST